MGGEGGSIQNWILDDMNTNIKELFEMLLCCFKLSILVFWKDHIFKSSTSQNESTPTNYKD